MQTLIQAIARMEGFGPPVNRATRNNNPGNLNFEPWQESAPYHAVLETIPAGVEETARFARFPSPDAGWGAMRTLLMGSYLGMNLAAALNKWAPPSDGNNQSSYQASVCSWMGVAPEAVLTEELIG